LEFCRNFGVTPVATAVAVDFEGEDGRAGGIRAGTGDTKLSGDGESIAVAVDFEGEGGRAGGIGVGTCDRKLGGDGETTAVR
jgi:hypothetical protein